jgi:hypothetical protein
MLSRRAASGILFTILRCCSQRSNAATVARSSSYAFSGYWFTATLSQGRGQNGNPQIPRAAWCQNVVRFEIQLTFPLRLNIDSSRSQDQAMSGGCGRHLRLIAWLSPVIPFGTKLPFLDGCRAESHAEDSHCSKCRPPLMLNSAGLARCREVACRSLDDQRRRFAGFQLHPKFS